MFPKSVEKLIEAAKDELANRKAEILTLKDEASKRNLKQYQAFDKFRKWVENEAWYTGDVKAKMQALYNEVMKK
jgi:hypothetical protein